MTTENPFVEEFQFQRENSLWCIDLAEARTDVPVQPSRSRLVRERSGGGDLSSQPALVVDQQTKRKKKNNSHSFTLTDEIVRPTDKDILFGRGRRINNHPGNVTFRCLVASKKTEYDKAPEGSKITIADGVIREIMNSGGRFLDRVDDRSPWYIVNDSDIRRKTTQRLREGNDPSQNQPAITVSSSEADALMDVSSTDDDRSEHVHIKETVHPNDNDVLFGRGRGKSDHIGNKCFRKIVGTFKNEYNLSNDNQQKQAIVQFIYDEIGRLEGRFLDRAHKAKSLWYAVSAERAKRKIGQALREKTAAGDEVIGEIEEDTAISAKCHKKTSSFSNLKTGRFYDRTMDLSAVSSVDLIRVKFNPITSHFTDSFVEKNRTACSGSIHHENVCCSLPKDATDNVVARFEYSQTTLALPNLAPSTTRTTDTSRQPRPGGQYQRQSSFDVFTALKREKSDRSLNSDLGLLFGEDNEDTIMKIAYL